MWRVESFRESAIRCLPKRRVLFNEIYSPGLEAISTSAKKAGIKVPSGPYHQVAVPHGAGIFMGRGIPGLLLDYSFSGATVNMTLRVFQQLC